MPSPSWLQVACKATPCGCMRVVFGPIQPESAPFDTKPPVAIFPVVTRPLLVIMRLSSCNIQGAVKMVHEISQFDIPVRQLLATNAQPRVCMGTDIGEARITRTIFGRAKVRVILERDKKRRAWLLTMLAVTALAAAAWQGWIAWQQMQSAAPPLSLSERIRVSAPVFQSEVISPSATPQSVRDRQRTPTQIIIDNMTTRREPAPQQPKPAVQMAIQPFTPPSLTAGNALTAKPQAPLATNNNVQKNQTVVQHPTKPPTPTQPAAPTTQPITSKPAADVPLVAPTIKEGASTLSPAGNSQPSGSVNVQP